jgi:hypothetical protein
MEVESMKNGARMSASERNSKASERESARVKRRPRSAITSGRKLLINGDPNSAWSRRYHDLITRHIGDLGGADMLSEAQLSLIRRAAALACEIEEMESRMSRGIEVSLDTFGRAASHLRRLYETLGLKRQPRDVTPTLAELIAQDEAEQAVEEAAAEAATEAAEARKAARQSRRGRRND